MKISKLSQCEVKTIKLQIKEWKFAKLLENIARKFELIKSSNDIEKLWENLAKSTKLCKNKVKTAK